MTPSVLELLDRSPSSAHVAERRAWLADVERSLQERPTEWIAAAGPPEDRSLGKDRAWVLLSWVEDVASLIGRETRAELVESAAFAMSLLEASPLDRRDVMVVAMLVRRAATVSGLDFTVHARRGCDRAGLLGARCRVWLLQVTDATPSTHEETGSDASFGFRRKPAGFDPAALERKLTKGTGGAASDERGER